MSDALKANSPRVDQSPSNKTGTLPATLTSSGILTQSQNPANAPSPAVARPTSSKRTRSQKAIKAPSDPSVDKAVPAILGVAPTEAPVAPDTATATAAAMLRKREAGTLTRPSLRGGYTHTPLDTRTLSRPCVSRGVFSHPPLSKRRVIEPASKREAGDRTRPSTRGGVELLSWGWVELGGDLVLERLPSWDKLRVVDKSKSINSYKDRWLGQDLLDR
ncbi:hypothetical protein MJO29_007657 [Puccinia striiformis f. sp. tritici]|uniref:hypothetical protein n=1 Tax=Puccinia striiformis f. sp. tritici TaxID=168172 RepID=UPI002007CC99|nr:hypothetical protein Pst134EA_013813 [Puccinia striiformis f. sp. tritici]KAH9465959.1 hypothetical protein Pst134EA_013813 [Puccinia striiformis f. sp. tritici]KAI7956258.1 hypothetical protein MJO29_007657 [Puccinia striiformis f. sp. tritici]